jgi:hypothetical protein
MSKRLAVVIAAVAALGIAGAAYADAGDLSHPVTIRTIQKGGNQEFLTLNPTRGDSTGNQFVISGPLFRAGTQHRIGSIRGFCVVTTKVFGIGQCDFTAQFSAGSVTVSGPLNFTPGKTDVLAVTGGTGHFRNARGQVVAQNTGRTSEGLTFELIP